MNFSRFLLFGFLIWGFQALAEKAHDDHGEAHQEAHKDEHKDEHTQAQENSADTRVYQMEDSGADAKIPKQLWNMIHENKPEKSLTFAPLKIRLQEKTKGVLVAPVVIIEMPRGGGEVDLSTFVRNLHGTFLVFFEYDEIRDTNEEQIFFVSRAKKRRLEKEIWGAGCNKFMDIKNFMTKEVLKKGLEVNTTRHRHLSVLGGTFVFSGKNKIAQVSFKDSTAPQFFCDPPGLPVPGSANEVNE